MKKYAFAAAFGAAAPSILYIQLSSNSFKRLLPVECNTVLEDIVFLTPDVIYPHLTCMGELGRTMYMEFYRFDWVLFPLIYTTILWGAFVHVWPNHGFLRVLPLISCCSDVMENTLTYFLLTEFPTRHESVETVIPVLAQTKLSVIFFASAVVILGLVARVFSHEPDVAMVKAKTS